MASRFQLGQTLITPGAASLLSSLGVSPLTPLALHGAGNWGVLDAEDRAANERALVDGSRLLSAYVFGGHKIWVITEAVDDDGQRAATTILLPSEY